MTSHRALVLVALLVALAGCGSRTTDEASFDTEVASDAGVDLLGKDAVDARPETLDVQRETLDVAPDVLDAPLENIESTPEAVDERVEADPGDDDPSGSAEGIECSELCDPPPECTPATVVADCETDDQCLVWMCVQGTCVSSPRTCDDGDPCSIDSCSPDSGCHSVWPPFPCDPCSSDGGPGCHDGLACTVDDCVACPASNPDCTGTGFTCAYKPYTCADGDNCTVDLCLGDTNGDGVGDCDNSPVTCDDDNACTADSCNPLNGSCEHVAMKAPDDGDACTDDYCNPFDGMHHDAIPCDDGDACTIDACDPGSGCVNVGDCELCPNDPGCGCLDDGACHTTNKCLQGTCVSLDGFAAQCVYTAIPCPPQPCRKARCEPAEGCVYEPEPVDDGDPCTDDACDLASGTITNEQRNCDDQDSCTDDTCDPETGECVNETKDCDDQNPCTLDLCVDGTCVHEPKACDDENLCTLDACDPATGLCMHAPVDVDDFSECTLDSCDPATGAIVHDVAFGSDDGNACTVDECTPDGWLHRPVEVDDQNLCTEDGCSTKLGVFHTPVVCAPPNLCTLTHCEPDVGCVAPTPKDCGDDDPCTIDACDPATGQCTHAIVSSDDGSPCTVDTCDPATGAMFHMPVPVDDGNACTLDSCDPPTGLILHLAVEIDDANRCTYDVCNPKQGVFHNPIVCLAPDLCHTAGCDPQFGCLAPIAKDCNDGDACTIDGCDGATGLCQYEPLGCDDDDACTIDDCDPELGCRNVPRECDDGSLCTVDTCDPVAGSCLHVTVDCDDGDGCTIDACHADSGGCAHTPLTCDDGNGCTVDTCNPDTGCGHATRDCSDSYVGDDGVAKPNHCTTDSCDPATGACRHAWLECEDGNYRTVDGCDPDSGCYRYPEWYQEWDSNWNNPSDKCYMTPYWYFPSFVNCFDDDLCTIDGACVPATGTCTSTPVDCDDNDACTIDTCDPKLGCQHAATVCEHQPCRFEVCDPHTGDCAWGPVGCDDGNPCTADSCDEANGACANAPADCADDNPCTIDSCDPVVGCLHAAKDCDHGCDPTSGDCQPLTCAQSDETIDVVFRLDYLSGRILEYSYQVAPRAPVTAAQAEDRAAHVGWDMQATYCCNYFDTQAFGDLYMSCNSPSDFGGHALVDARNGATVLLATCVWMGDGRIYVPTPAMNRPASDLAWLETDPPPPASVRYDTCYWEMGSSLAPWALVRRTTLVSQVAACGDYRVQVFGNAETIGMFYPGNASWIVIVTGTAPQWTTACSADSCPPGYFCGTAGCVWCNDGDPCTTDGLDPVAGSCQHLAVNCDDGKPCTIDECYPGYGCVHRPDFCSDYVEGPSGLTRNLCTTDSCDQATGQCLHQPKDCDDANACTTDACDAATGMCTHTTLICDDDNACTDDVCAPATGQCTHTPRNCADTFVDDLTGETRPNPCTVDSCNPVSGCMHTLRMEMCCDCCSNPSCDPRTDVFTYTCGCVREVSDPIAGGCYLEPIDCTDDDPCTVDDCNYAIDACSHEAKYCGDANPYTTDSCDPSTGDCLHVWGATCSDNNPCTIDVVIDAVGGPCEPGDSCHCESLPKNCNDSNACTADTCNVLTGECRNKTVQCTAPNACFVPSCDPAVGCKLAPVDCDDGDVCTRDECDPATGLCEHAAVCDFTACDSSTCDPVLRTCTILLDACEGDFTTGEICSFDCSEGFCDLSCQRVCFDDGNPCTYEYLGIDGVCYHPLKTCDDGTACTVDTCNGLTGACDFEAVDCDDGDPTTRNWCDPSEGCLWTPDPCPPDGNLCTIESPEDPCVHWDKVCDDSNHCTVDDCDPSTGDCRFIDVNCDDANTCTTDTCDPALGCRHAPIEGCVP